MTSARAPASQVIVQRTDANLGHRADEVPKTVCFSEGFSSFSGAADLASATDRWDAQDSSALAAGALCAAAAQGL